MIPAIEVISQQHSGQNSFVISTPSASYIYHKEGCGFASLLDKEKKDWISYRPTGGEYGHYRGIPNMGLEAFGHPGYHFAASSQLELKASNHVRIASQSADTTWQCHWDIFSDFALHTVRKTPQPFWWLYEGTPDGYSAPDTQTLLLANGDTYPCSTSFEIAAHQARWVCFLNRDNTRGLLLAAYSQEKTTDCYWQMGAAGGMTVFGFGRTDKPLKGWLSELPAQFAVSLIEQPTQGRLEQQFKKIDKQRKQLVKAVAEQC